MSRSAIFAWVVGGWRRVHLTIHQKLIGLIAVMITAIVGFLTIYLPGKQIDNIRTTLVSRANGYGSMLSRQLQSAVAFADRETAREVLSSLQSDRDIRAIVLFGGDGQLLYQEGTPGSWVVHARRDLTRPRVLMGSDEVAVIAPVISAEGPRGTLVVELSTSRMVARMKGVIATAVAAGVAALLFGIAAAWLISRSLSRRLRAIAGVATAVASGESPGATVDDDSSDEIGSLAKAFNRMVNQLHAEQDRLRGAVAELTSAEDAIARVNRELEDRVQVRTAELTAANEKLVIQMERRSAMEVELRQAQKLESVGRLASGIAHEINTPIQFVSDSCHFLRDAAGDIAQVIAGYRGILTDVGSGSTSAADASARAEELEDGADLEYLLENVPLAVGRAIDGMERVATIVRAMKEFAYPARKEKAPADINRAIQTTLMVSKNEYKYVAEISTDLDELPQVRCHIGEFNQVILNIVVNAAHAIQDVVGGTGSKGEIEIKTRLAAPNVLISIRDTGKGIPPEIVDKIFDPFFTTKEVGKGTGQGLAIARSVVVEKHGGALTVESEPGRGTTFTISLPIDGGPASTTQQIALAG